MSAIADNYLRVWESVARLAQACGRKEDEITVIAVSKTYSVDAVREVYGAGCRDFGESRVQEALPKIESGASDLRWHLIGTLQANKVRKVIGKFCLIHAVDNLELACKISSCSQEIGIESQVLLQVNTSGETSKRGLSVGQWEPHLDEVMALPNLKVEGLMTMAPLTDDERVVRECFRRLRHFRDQLRLRHLSMGMSHDYPIAIEEGATLLRIGTVIFGER